MPAFKMLEEVNRYKQSYFKKLNPLWATVFTVWCAIDLPLSFHH
jgi:hypothetical protein